jgi:amino acid adenylation domain-containing protein
MAGHFDMLLEGIVTESGQRISALPLVTTGERRQLVKEWNDTKAEYPRESCIHQLFEQQVERTPRAIAVVYEQEAVSYEELNRRANQVAHYLRTMRVGPEVKVGICMERSVDMVVGLLGILKAGGAYVPFDTGHPRERLSFMLNDAGVSVVLTQLRLRESLPDRAAKVCLDADWNRIACHSHENVPARVLPENLAYVIYTSGSTGKPKGVQIPHYAVVNFIDSMRQQPGIDDRDVLLAVTAISFDIAGLELYLPLCAGARLTIVSGEEASHAIQLGERIDSSGATLMQATPSTWRLLKEAGWNGNNRLKILCGGEALSRPLANWLRDRSAVLWNMYGPTETTIWSTAYEVRSSDGPVSIGRPIANTQVYLLDRHLNIVPVGIPGELCIGGAGLCRGYLNLPDLTADKIIPNPFSDDPGSRLYRTGDVARRLADGNVEFLGRADLQVKIRGFRVELEEIEAALIQHPALSENVVVYREDLPGEKRLVAYIACNNDQLPTVNELRSFLSEKLPQHMIPAAFVIMDELPLTANQKIDRRSLPAPPRDRWEVKKGFVGARTLVEDTLTQIWEEVLRIKPIGIYDNFFEVGGDSILSIQVIARAQRAGLQITPRHIFQLQTIAEMAEALGTAPAIQAEHIEVGDRVPRLPMLSGEVGYYTPLDFPEADLTQEELAEILADLEALKGGKNEQD